MAARVAVRSLALTHFRNYAEARLEISSSCVILSGLNGAGKTNLLEAVSFLSPGRGLRRARLSEVDQQGAPSPWVVSATVETPQGEVQIGTGRDAAAEAESDKRLVKIDGRPARGHAELSRYVSVTWLTPQMDRIFMEGASVRRRFLDRLVYGFDALHAARVSEYEQAMRERNRLLAMNRADENWLQALERRMAETGASIAAARLQAVEHINAAMEQAKYAFPRALLSVRGLSEDALAAGASALSAEQALAEALASGRAADAASGRTLSGAHKSTLSVWYAEKNMEAEFCSTGEQKALLLSIALAEVRAAGAWRGQTPILLLDEAAAHLDAARREELFHEILSLGAQTWLTGTDLHLFEGLQADSKTFRVKSGSIAAL